MENVRGEQQLPLECRHLLSREAHRIFFAEQTRWWKRTALNVQTSEEEEKQHRENVSSHVAM